jgi:hypothetical protein
MKLRQKESVVHLSHFHRYVSAYETTTESVGELGRDIANAIEVARRTKKAQIVDQDCLEHVFIVYPSGAICLYRKVGSYTVYDAQSDGL